MKMTKRKFKGELGELIFYCALIALPLLQIAIFYFYVNFNSFLMAFQKYKYPDKFILQTDMLKNFKDILYQFKEVSTLKFAFKNSLISWFLTSGLGTFLTIVFSYYIFKKWPFAKTFKFFLFLPSVLPSVLLTGIFTFFVNKAVPEYAALLTGEKMEALLLRGTDTLFPTVMFYNVWICFGAQLLIYTGAMDQISPEIIEAGKVDGVTPIREFFSIVVPMILPTVATFIVASVATIFTNQANLFAFFGKGVGSKNETLGYHLFVLISDTTKMDKYPYASALGMICTLIAFPLTMIVRKLLDRGEV